MHLKSLTLKGFKSFPDRTTLDFGPGVSVVVGPNGSGKSNVTDAVLWAMGEQSPLAVRAQSMQDVIFGGGRGVQARSAAEVEIVLDNGDGTVALPASEISIVRRLDRAGEGGYRLNGARCRLADVIEVLSDTGLGKETHSVISQGRVESIVTSKPRERRLLVEEAAGLGKHRKRRRRAQLKLERTQENLDRALDVEREARTRLRPLKRQAEAAELHERLERQALEARWTLACDAARTLGAELSGAEARVAAARARREQIEARLQAVVRRRGEAERALTQRSERHDELARRAYDARSARDRVSLRAEQAGASGHALARRVERLQAELAAPIPLPAPVHPPNPTEPAPASVAAASGPGETHGGADRAWESAWERVRGALAEGVRRALGEADEHARSRVLEQALADAERLGREAVERALAEALASGEPERERRRAELAAAELSERTRRIEQLRGRLAADEALRPVAERLQATLERLAEAIDAGVVARFQRELEQDSSVGEEAAGELRACAGEEAEIQTALRTESDTVTEAEVGAQRLRDQARELETELRGIAERLERPLPADEEQPELLAAEDADALRARVARLARRREQLGPVNPLAKDEYAQALAHVEELESRREDLQTALRELRTVIRDTDRQISETFEATFAAAAANFGELVGDLFPGGSGRLRLVREEQPSTPAIDGERSPEPDAENADPAGSSVEDGAEAQAEREELGQADEPDPMGVEIEITPAGKSAKRLSLLSGGEKSLTALAFLFAVFLARPCPFYILDEVEAALDDVNLDRFLSLLRRYADRAQFIVITHQRRTMEAADWLYGVSMATDGVSKVLSRRLPPREDEPQQDDGQQVLRPPTGEAADDEIAPGETAPAEGAHREVPDGAGVDGDGGEAGHPEPAASVAEIA